LFPTGGNKHYFSYGQNGPPPLEEEHEKMIRISKSVTVATPLEDVFAYLADFSNTAEWDPGVDSATRTSGGEIGPASTFHLVTNFRGRQIPVDYEIASYDPPNRLVFVGEGKRFAGTDDIQLTPIDDNTTKVTWTADFALKGIGRLFESFMKGTFEDISQHALDGLGDQLGRD
jgi:carbon monoxide dehydrogenase subunit G